MNTIYSTKDERSLCGTPMSRLTEADACMVSRDFAFVPKESAQPENYFRTIIIRDTIRYALIYSVREPAPVMEYMQSRYAECGFKNYQQKQAQLLWDHRRVMRYLKSEPRRPSFPAARAVRIGSAKYDVRVDAVFECGDQAELVVFKAGKPTMTRTGRGNAFQRDLQLYAMQLYGRQLGYKNITASFYFLRKDTDAPYWNKCEQNFFGNGGNVIQLKDLYDGEENELDRRMLPLVKKNEYGISGEEQDEKTCRYCDKYDICKYTLPPARLSDENATVVLSSVQKVCLSDAQEKAAGFDCGIARIIAGAGSGKTGVIVERVRRLLEKGVKPQAILMITFTKAGAGEMKRRIERAAGKELPGLTVTTFNAFYYGIVRDCREKLGFGRMPRVIDDVEEFGIIADLLNENPIPQWNGRAFINYSASGTHGNRGALRIAADVFRACKKSKTKSAGINMSSVRTAASQEEISDAALVKLMALYDKYEKLMLEKGLIDFDDQEFLAFRVIDEDPSYLKEHFPFEHIIIDEFQDSSRGQIELLKRLKGLPSFRSLMAVGDDSQSIFGFRETSPEYIINFEDYIEEPVQDIVLDRNFRSTPQICAFGEAVISPNREKVEKDLVSARPSGAPVIVNGFYSEKDEIAYIVRGIRQHLDNGEKPEDIAVIAATKRELQKIADALTKEGISSMFCAPEPLSENSRIRAVLAFARVIRDPGNTKDALTAANALMGGGIMKKPLPEVEKAVQSLTARAEEIRSSNTPREMFLRYLEEIAYGDEAVEHFREALENKDYEEIIDYCRSFSLYGEGVEYRRTQEYPGVVLVTAHSAKGLEWKTVYNTITHYPKGGTIRFSETEETRRLLFVSATRAKDELYVTGLYANGTKLHRTENRLLKEAFDAVRKTWDYIPC